MFFKSNRKRSGNEDNKKGRELFEPDILALTLHGRRDVGSTGHAHAMEHIAARMTEAGLAPFRGDSFKLPYNSGGGVFVNLAGILPGAEGGGKSGAFLLGAHYDTCGPYPGADDNASSVTITMNIISRLTSLPLHRDLIVVFFDAEEPPYYFTDAMGSIRFFRDHLAQPIDNGSCERAQEKPPDKPPDSACSDPPVAKVQSSVDFALILDLLGHDVPVPGIENLLFMTGMESHRTIGGILGKMEIDRRIRIVPICNSYVGDMSDHYIFRINRVPYLFASCGRWPHYHTAADTPDKLNYGKMLAISEFLHALLVELNGRDFPPDGSNYDTTSLELKFMNAAVGNLLKTLGLPPPRTRSEMERIIFTLMHKFGI